jgi:hypothetical protein
MTFSTMCTISLLDGVGRLKRGCRPCVVASQPSCVRHRPRWLSLDDARASAANLRSVQYRPARPSECSLTRMRGEAFLQAWRQQSRKTRSLSGIPFRSPVDNTHRQRLSLEILEQDECACPSRRLFVRHNAGDSSAQDPAWTANF